MYLLLLFKKRPPVNTTHSSGPNSTSHARTANAWAERRFSDTTILSLSGGASIRFLLFQ
jgi:hypothetical protein